MEVEQAWQRIKDREAEKEKGPTQHKLQQDTFKNFNRQFCQHYLAINL